MFVCVFIRKITSEIIMIIMIIIIIIIIIIIMQRRNYAQDIPNVLKTLKNCVSHRFWGAPLPPAPRSGYATYRGCNGSETGGNRSSFSDIK